MNLTQLTNSLSSSLAQSQSDLQTAMNSDLSDPMNWTQIQMATMMYSNEVGLVSGEIGAFKTMISNILQHL